MPVFWRDAALPFIEARAICNGRGVNYGTHAHDTFSIGAVNRGTSTYVNQRAKETIGAGTVVLMNPEDAHACNPSGDHPWSYCMLYVDVTWLTSLQHQLGFSGNADFRPFLTMSTTALYARVNQLHATLIDGRASQIHKEIAAIAFFTDVQQLLDPAPHMPAMGGAALARAADFINDNFRRALTVDDICAAANLSPAHLIRSFKNRFGMTPHAYLINRRIEYGRHQLKRGKPIAAVAQDAGFADQAHFQRAFKRHCAATPGQYRGRGGS